MTFVNTWLLNNPQFQVIRCETVERKCAKSGQFDPDKTNFHTPSGGFADFVIILRYSYVSIRISTPSKQYTKKAENVQILHRYQAFCVYSLLVWYRISNISCFILNYDVKSIRFDNSQHLWSCKKFWWWMLVNGFVVLINWYKLTYTYADHAWFCNLINTVLIVNGHTGYFQSENLHSWWVTLTRI